MLSAGVAHGINTPLQYARDNLNFVREALTAANEAMEEVKPRLDQEVANETWSRFDLEFHARRKARRPSRMPWKGWIESAISLRQSRSLLILRELPCSRTTSTSWS